MVTVVEVMAAFCQHFCWKVHNLYLVMRGMLSSIATLCSNMDQSDDDTCCSHIACGFRHVHSCLPLVLSCHCNKLWKSISATLHPFFPIGWFNACIKFLPSYINTFISQWLHNVILWNTSSFIIIVPFTVMFGDSLEIFSLLYLEQIKQSLKFIFKMLTMLLSDIIISGTVVSHWTVVFRIPLVTFMLSCHVRCMLIAKMILLCNGQFRQITTASVGHIKV